MPALVFKFKVTVTELCLYSAAYHLGPRFPVCAWNMPGIYHVYVVLPHMPVPGIYTVMVYPRIYPAIMMYIHQTGYHTWYILGYLIPGHVYPSDIPGHVYPSDWISYMVYPWISWIYHVYPSSIYIVYRWIYMVHWMYIHGIY